MIPSKPFWTRDTRRATTAVLALILLAAIVVASQAPRFMEIPPSAGQVPVPPNGTNATGNRTLAGLFPTSSPGMALSFDAPTRLSEGAYRLDRANATVSFAPNAFPPADWRNAIHVEPQGEAPFLLLTPSHRPTITASWSAANGSRHAMDIWLSFGDALISLEVPPTQDLKSFGNCTTTWKYRGLPGYENQTQPSGSKEGVQMLLRIPAGGRIDVQFAGEASPCPNLALGLKHLGTLRN